MRDRQEEAARSDPLSAAAADGPEVLLDEVTKHFAETGGAVRALAGVSLAVPRGGFTAIVGPSGSGKSTLLRVVADLVPPSAGRVQVCGHAPSVARRRRELGIVFQAPVLYEWRSVRGNVELPLELADVPADERRARAEETLSLVGLREHADRPPRGLSGGMQQRVAIARALALRPRVLLMDEPFGALDELTRERLNDELLRVWRETGVTVLFVTHDIDEAVYLADEIVVLTPAPGRVAARVPVELPRPRRETVRTSEAYFSHLNRVRHVLRDGRAGATGAMIG